jgi:hypothetical protein
MKETDKNVDWEYEEIPIGSIKNMLELYDVEVDSPDGFVEILDFVEKGYHKQFVFVSLRGDIVRCSGGHLFETALGWISAENIALYNAKIEVLHDDGKYYESTVVECNLDIPIVDISVNHENRRYYTNGVSSHNTGAGKTLVMCHMAASLLMFGKNVLYITLEMAEERIAERIDSNLLDVTLDELREMPKSSYEKKIDRLKGKTPGKLIIKEYPTGSANAGHIRYLLNDMKLKKGFVPDIVFVDYLNLCSSFRLKGSNAANSYTIVKNIAEELRGLAMEFDIPVVSATQANRSGFGNSDIDLTNTSESIGLPATADAMFALISSEELQSMGQLMIKQLKNRWGDISYYKRFVVGIDRSKMKLYNLEETAQGNIQSESSYSRDDKPTFDKSSFGEGFNKKSKRKFELEDIQ